VALACCLSAAGLTGGCEREPSRLLLEAHCKKWIEKGEECSCPGLEASLGCCLKGWEQGGSILKDGGLKCVILARSLQSIQAVYSLGVRLFRLLKCVDVWLK